MENLTIKGTSIEIISFWLKTIKDTIPETEEKEKYKHIILDPSTKNLLSLIKSIFPGIITTTEEKDCCAKTLLDDLLIVENLINPLLELKEKKP